MLVRKRTRLKRVLIAPLVFSVSTCASSFLEGDQTPPGLVPITMEITPPTPGVIVNVKYSCEASLGGSECLRLTKPDAVVANFAAFEPFVFTTPGAGGMPASCSAPAPQPAAVQCYIWQRFWRYSFEGVLKIPNSPLILGLSAKVSAERPKSTGFIMAADDLRFLFGVRFDAA